MLAAPAASVAVPDPVLPTANAKWDYQIGKPYDPRDGVTVVSRDRTVAPLAEAYTMCYVNAYQTQPDAVRWWKNNHPELLLKKATAATSSTATGARSSSTSARRRSARRLPAIVNELDHRLRRRRLRGRRAGQPRLVDAVRRTPDARPGLRVRRADHRPRALGGPGHRAEERRRTDRARQGSRIRLRRR